MGYTGGATSPTKEETALYGRDLFHDGDLRVAQNGDYQIVEGIENYRRAILRRLSVRPGEYRARPNYGAGVQEFVKKRLTTTARAELVARVSEQVRRDRRTEKVLGVEVTTVELDGGAYLKISVRVQTIGRVVEFAPFFFGGI